MAPETSGTHDPAYRCSGDMPADHVECDFVCDTFEQAMDHFETTSHSVDEACLAVECETPYHTATYSDLTCGECGLTIMPLQSVEYDVAAGIAYHTDRYHVEAQS